MEFFALKRKDESKDNIKLTNKETVRIFALQLIFWYAEIKHGFFS